MLSDGKELFKEIRMLLGIGMWKELLSERKGLL
jgi:hypothetical protein